MYKKKGERKKKKKKKTTPTSWAPNFLIHPEAPKCCKRRPVSKNVLIL